MEELINETPDGIDRMMEVYNSISGEEDESARLAIFLTHTNYYTLALKLSNEINGRQGKLRATISDRTTRLMGYSLDVDVNEVTDAELTELFLNIINTYLVDKLELPNDKPRVRDGIISRVKALFMMLVTSNQYWIIPKINPIPKYILGMVSGLFEHIRAIKDEALNGFIDYLKSTNNDEMIAIVVKLGNDFWGTETTKPNVVYDRYFSHMMDRINNPKETYESYLYFRSQYRKSTKKIVPSKIYEIFQITPDAYRRARENVYQELQQLFPQSEYAKSIRKLIYEQ